jgi:hypothetical protein
MTRFLRFPHPILPILTHFRAQASFSGFQVYTGKASDAFLDAICTLHAGSFTTFWNVADNRGSLDGSRVPADFGPWINVIGAPTRFPTTNTAARRTWLLEQVSMTGPNATPNLYQAMKEKRMASPNKVSALLGGKGNGGVLLSAPPLA